MFLKFENSYVNVDHIARITFDGSNVIMYGHNMNDKPIMMVGGFDQISGNAFLAHILANTGKKVVDITNVLRSENHVRNDGKTEENNVFERSVTSENTQ